MAAVLNQDNVLEQPPRHGARRYNMTGDQDVTECGNVWYFWLRLAVASVEELSLVGDIARCPLNGGDRKVREQFRSLALVSVNAAEVWHARNGYSVVYCRRMLECC